MTEEQINQYIASFALGQTREIDLHADSSGGADVELLRSEVQRYELEMFILTTYFREFWAGHGWSGEQSVSEYIGLKNFRKKLINVPA